LIGGIAWLLAQPWVKDLPILGTVAAWSAGLGAVVVATLLFPGFVAGLVGLFLDDVAEAVEARHYPHLPAPRDVPLLESIVASLRLMAFAVGLNIVLLPLYLVLFFIPPLNLVVFYAVNGRLLGREYFEAVGLRRLTSDEARIFAQTHKRTLWLTGTFIALLLTVPLLNMLVPVIAAAAVVHVFQKLTRAP
jgi:CysZ protein